MLARVDVLGHHRGLQLSNGRRKQLFEGDEIVVAFGNRYAPSQFEAVIPKTLGPCQLVASGGVAAKAVSWHSKMTRGATQITPLGFLVDTSGETVNLASRLCGMAPAGEVYLSAATANEVTGALSLEAIGEHQMKGFSKGCHVFRVKLNALIDPVPLP